MKTLILNIDDEVFDRIKSALIIKSMTDSMFGVLDEFTTLIVNSIETGVAEKTIKFRDQAKKEKLHETSNA